MRNNVLNSLLIAAAITAFAVSSVVAQCPDERPNGYCPETALRPGEVPLWQMQFKGAHNAYQLNEPMDQQIDDYNNWMLEIDLHWQGLDEELWVEHHCQDATGNQTFDASISEIANSITADQRVTFIYIGQGQVGGAGFDCYVDWPLRSVYFEAVTDVLFAHIPQDKFYTHADFRDIDNFRWPTLQELVRRGQHFVPIFYERDSDGYAPSVNENFFFNSSAGVPDESNPQNMAFAQRDGGCDGGGTPDAWTADPRFLMRGFPSSSCSLSCFLQDGSYFEDGINQGFTFITNNCVDNDLCVDSRIHSPMPYYVAHSGDYDHNWGTWAYPRVGAGGLYNAIQDADPMVNIRISPGTYNLTSVDLFIINQKTISEPIVLENRGGAADVVIQ